ncbi:MAG: hypothetical protein K2X74_15660, partial [Acetobacteraceae bacterium]|nr:hypothetical protein [Acetobacteraceae bacterium]
EGERVVPGGRSGFADDGSGTGCWIWMGGIPRGATEIRARWSGACPEGPAEGTGRSEMTWREGGTPRAMVYEGTLVRGKAEGQGVLTHLEDGRTVVIERGEYRNDHFVQGRIEFLRNRIIYEGGWAPGGPHGRGRLETPGGVFDGVWERGCLRTKEGWLSFTRPAAECEGSAT